MKTRGYVKVWTARGYVKVQTADPLPPAGGERRWGLHVWTTRGERVSVQVNSRTGAEAIRRVLRRAVFADERIEIAAVDVVEVSS